MGCGGADCDLPTRQTIYKVARELKREHNSLFNCLNSILVDASFVNEIVGLYPSVPLLANLRCGLWYTQNPDHTCYFKSTDGHAGAWLFSTVRLNWHVAELAAEKGGCIIVDATRKGKRFPDALSKTIPIWTAVINRAVARVRAAMPPPCTTSLESFEEPDIFVDDTQSIIPDVGCLQETPSMVPLWTSTHTEEPFSNELSPNPSPSPSLSMCDEMGRPICSLMSLKEWLLEGHDCDKERRHSSSYHGRTFSGHASHSNNASSGCMTSYKCATSQLASSAHLGSSPTEPIAIVEESKLIYSPFASAQVGLISEAAAPTAATPRLPQQDPPLSATSTPVSTPASFAFLASSPSSSGTLTPELQSESSELQEPEWDTSLHLPLWVPDNERKQMEALLDGYVDDLMAVGVDVERLAKTLKKPLRPLWVSQSSLIWVDEAQQPSQLPFTPLFLVSASMPHEHRRSLPLQGVLNGTQEEEGSDGTFNYVPGAGDDEESWARGLTAALFWRHHQELLQAGPSAVKSVTKRLVANAPKSDRCGVPRSVPAAVSGPTDRHCLKPMGCKSIEGVSHSKTESGIYWIGNTGIGIGGFDAGSPPVVWGLVDTVLNCGLQQHPTFVDMVTCMSCKLGTDTPASSVSTLWTASSCSLAYNPHPTTATTAAAAMLSQYSRSPPINIHAPSTWQTGHRSHRLAACLSSGALVDDLTQVFDSGSGGESCGSHDQPQSPGAGSGEDTLEPLWDIDAVEAQSPAHALHMRQYPQQCQQFVGTTLAAGGSNDAALSHQAAGLWAGSASSLPERPTHSAPHSRLLRPTSTLATSLEDSRSNARSVDFAHELFSGRVSGTSNSSGSCVSGGSMAGSVGAPAACERRRRPRIPACPTCRQVAQTMASDRYLWLPVLSSKHDRSDLCERMEDALAFIWRALSAGKRVLIHDDDGLDACVCIAVAALLAFFDAPDIGSSAHFSIAAAPRWRPASWRCPLQFVSTEEITKQSVRQRLAVVSSLYPPARPTRGMLKQVYNFFHPQHRPECTSP